MTQQKQLQQQFNNFFCSGPFFFCSVHEFFYQNITNKIIFRPLKTLSETKKLIELFFWEAFDSIFRISFNYIFEFLLYCLNEFRFNKSTRTQKEKKRKKKCNFLVIINKELIKDRIFFRLFDSFFFFLKI